MRSPGSTLKPIIYGLAFEAGLAHPETLIEDRPTRFGVYVPKNFDQDWHGTVTIRMALAQSLNIPAVKVLEALGPQQAVRPLRPGRRRAGAAQGRRADAGHRARRPRPQALAISPTLYTGLARGGEPIALRYRRDQRRGRQAAAAASPRLLSPVAAWYVTDILRNAPAPANAKPGQIAYKTGTSYGFRDAWAVGYDGRHTIAVWVGRPDGAATPGLAGRTAAAPLLFDAFARLAHAPRARSPAAPSGALASPAPTCRRRSSASARRRTSTPPGAYLEPAVQIAFPPDRSELDVEDGDGASVVVKAEGGALPLTWLVDGVPIESDPARREAELPAASRGFHKLSVIDAKGRADRVTIRLK